MRGVNTNPNALVKCLAASEPNFAFHGHDFKTFLQLGNFLPRRFHKNNVSLHLRGALYLRGCSSLAKKYSLLRECVIKRTAKTVTDLRHMEYTVREKNIK